MSASQTTIAVIYDYDQTLSPTYMQDETLFPHFGINPTQFWKKSRELVDKEGYDGELAYLKCMLDYLSMDRPTNDELRSLGAKLRYFKGVPEVFEELNHTLSNQHRTLGIKIEHYIVSSGLKKGISVHDGLCHHVFHETAVVGTNWARGLRHVNRADLLFGFGPEEGACIAGPHELAGGAMHASNAVTLANQKSQTKGVARCAK